VFSAAHRVKDRTIALCETLTHEVGHMLGLDHSADCDDVMNITNAACNSRDYTRGSLRGFRRDNWADLASSLAAWSRHVPDAQIASTTKDQPQTSRARVVPPRRKTRTGGAPLRR